MSPRARLMLGAAAGLVAAVVVLSAANATWRTVTPTDVVVDAGDDQVVLRSERAIKGTTQDASLSLFGIAGAAAAILAPLLAATPRIGASAFLTASGMMVAASATITRGVRSIPDAWLGGNDPAGLTFSPPTAASAFAIAGGIAMAMAGVWLLTAARRAPRLTMPEGAPESAPGSPREPDEGSWE